MSGTDKQSEILRALKEQTHILQRIERHLRPARIDDRRPGEMLEEPAGWPFGSRSVPVEAEGYADIDPMTE